MKAGAHERTLPGITGKMGEPFCACEGDQAGVFPFLQQERDGRNGFFWSERFKSVIVDNGETLINCLAYIDLNPCRAGIVEKPEE